MRSSRWTKALCAGALVSIGGCAGNPLVGTWASVYDSSGLQQSIEMTLAADGATSFRVTASVAPPTCSKRSATVAGACGSSTAPEWSARWAPRSIPTCRSDASTNRRGRYRRWRELAARPRPSDVGSSSRTRRLSRSPRVHGESQRRWAEPRLYLNRAHRRWANVLWTKHPRGTALHVASRALLSLDDDEVASDVDRHDGREAFAPLAQRRPRARRTDRERQSARRRPAKRLDPRTVAED